MIIPKPALIAEAEHGPVVHIRSAIGDVITTQDVDEHAISGSMQEKYT